jgi:hypothetical protein
MPDGEGPTPDPDRAPCAYIVLGMIIGILVAQGTYMLFVVYQHIKWAQ